MSQFADNKDCHSELKRVVLVEAADKVGRFLQPLLAAREECVGLVVLCFEWKNNLYGMC